MPKIPLPNEPLLKITLTSGLEMEVPNSFMARYIKFKHEKYNISESEVVPKNIKERIILDAIEK